MKIIWVAGARPNFMKIAPIWRAMERFNAARKDGEPRFEPLLVHTGQHYDQNMSDVFFRDLELPEPHYHLGIHGGTHGEQVARILVAFEKLLEKERPDMVGVVGDVNSTSACAMATAKSYVLDGGRTPKLIHVEAGLRSGDRLMPEEINRLVTDSIADILFTSEPSGTENLLREGIAAEKVHFAGNVMVDSLFYAISRNKKNTLLENLGWTEEESSTYALVTIHRPSNVDDPQMLHRVFSALEQIGSRLPVLFPVHPRSLARMKEAGIAASEISREPTVRQPGLYLMEPLGYHDFLSVMRNSTLVVTDSGGIQEETTALEIPCLTLRENTERPATVELGSNILLGQDTEKMVVVVDRILGGDSKKGAVPPLWDGKAAERIVDVLSRKGRA